MYCQKAGSELYPAKDVEHFLHGVGEYGIL
jgi:hypothetical protein